MSADAQSINGLWRTVDAYTPAPKQPLWRRAVYVVLASSVFMMLLPNAVVVSDVSHTMIGFEPFPNGGGRARPAENVGTIWLAEETETQEWHSNGLRIDNAFRVRNEPRFYQMLDRSDGMKPAADWISEPVGIVYHTTESPQAPFDPAESANLRRLSQSLLSHVRDNRSYNFVIDRFGRVFRVVDEDDVAHHAGNSLWADGRWALVNLNASFLAIAFEAQGSAVTGAQVLAGRLLTQFLRSKYKIRPELCVTHAQVSVNPSNLKLGYHTDWASGFPFTEMGLANNYDLPLTSITDFGFEYDEAFLQAVGSKIWRGIEEGEAKLSAEARHRGRDVALYRAELQERYRRLYASLKLTGALDEGSKSQ